MLRECCAGVDVVFHTAALMHFHARLPCQYKPSYDVNIVGTKVCCCYLWLSLLTVVGSSSSSSSRSSSSSSRVVVAVDRWW